MSTAAWVALAAIAAAFVMLGIATRAVAAARAERREAALAMSRAEHAALEASEARADAAQRDEILGAMTEGVILAAGSAVVYANPSAARLFGVDELRALPPQLPVASEQVRVEDLVVHHPTYRELRCVVARVGGGRTLVVAQEVTEQKRLDRIRRDFVANASHELKTPVAAILATAETLPGTIGSDPDAAARFASALAREAKALSRLVEDLLDLTRLEQTRPTAEPVDLGAIVTMAVDEIRERAGARTIRFRVDGTPSVTGSREDLEVMTRNLLDNAIRYTNEDGSIEVSLGATVRAAVLRIKDDGIGVPQRDLPRIFERFYRVDRARSRATGGTGLGLSLVRHIVEAHGGTIAAESELGAGSTFTVTLPLGGDIPLSASASHG